MDSLGRTTCLTGTDTAGTTNFTKAAAAASVADVNGTPASVNTAIAAIANGTLTGLVPGVGLIKAVDTANTALAAYGKTAATTNAAADTNKDGVLTTGEATLALSAASDARFVVASGGQTDSTAILNAKVTDTAKVAADAKTVATTATSAVAVSSYESALAAYKALVGTADAQAAAAVALGASQGGVDAALTAGTTTTLAKIITAGTVGGVAPTYTNASDVYTALLTGGLAPTERVKVIAELNKVPTFGAELVAAANKANAITAQDGVVSGLKGAAGSPVDLYATALNNANTAVDNLTKAQTADTKLAAIKVVTDKYVALQKAVDDAKGEVVKFDTANDAKVDIVNLSAAAATVQASAKSDVFYFADKQVSATAGGVAVANDFTIGGTTNFGVGDSIVLGSGYTFNSGALSTGNANTLEFFLVKSATGTQVVIETEAFANSNTVVDANGTVTASPNASVINLVGVTADHLSVANGVVSFV